MVPDHARTRRGHRLAGRGRRNDCCAAICERVRATGQCLRDGTDRSDRETSCGASLLDPLMEKLAERAVSATQHEARRTPANRHVRREHTRNEIAIVTLFDEARVEAADCDKRRFAHQHVAIGKLRYAVA